MYNKLKKLKKYRNIKKRLNKKKRISYRKRRSLFYFKNKFKSSKIKQKLHNDNVEQKHILKEIILMPFVLMNLTLEYICPSSYVYFLNYLPQIINKKLFIKLNGNITKQDYNDKIKLKFYIYETIIDYKFEIYKNIIKLLQNLDEEDLTCNFFYDYKTYNEKTPNGKKCNRIYDYIKDIERVILNKRNDCVSLRVAQYYNIHQNYFDNGYIQCQDCSTFIKENSMEVMDLINIRGLYRLITPIFYKIVCKDFNCIYKCIYCNKKLKFDKYRYKTKVYNIYNDNDNNNYNNPLKLELRFNLCYSCYYNKMTIFDDELFERINEKTYKELGYIKRII
jgi:hypothetical protein